MDRNLQKALKIAELIDSFPEIELAIEPTSARVEILMFAPLARVNKARDEFLRENTLALFAEFRPTDIPGIQTSAIEVDEQMMAHDDARIRELLRRFLEIYASLR